MMAGPVSWALILLAGFSLGIVFYGGLWATIRALPGSRHPVLLALGSFWGRSALVITGLILTTAGRWQNAVICLVGFLLARIALARWMPRAPAGKGVM
jgi:F1F0 ATPase subunit 2